MYRYNIIFCCPLIIFECLFLFVISFSCSSCSLVLPVLLALPVLLHYLNLVLQEARVKPYVSTNFLTCFCISYLFSKPTFLGQVLLTVISKIKFNCFTCHRDNFCLFYDSILFNHNFITRYYVFTNCWITVNTTFLGNVFITIITNKYLVIHIPPIFFFGSWFWTEIRNSLIS